MDAHLDLDVARHDGEPTRRRLKPAANPGRWAIAITALLLAATAAVTAYTVRVERSDTRARLERDADVAVGAIEQRLVAYGEVLVAVRGLFEAGARPSRARFRRFVRSLQVEARYPGVKVIAFAEAVEPFERRAFQRAVRRDAAGSGSPYPPFSVHPARGDARARQVAIDYLEPVEGNGRAFGFDLLSEPRRADALARTQRTGRLAATAPLRLLQARRGGPGFVFMLAVRGAHGPLDSPRTGRFRGVVSAAFHSEDLLSNVLGTRADDFDLEVYDVGAGGAARPRPPSIAGLVYDLDGTPDAVRDVDGTPSWHIDVGGRRWAIYYTLRASTGDATASIVATGGAVASLLAGWLVFTLAHGRSLARRLAARMTRDLEASREQLLTANSGLRASEKRVRQIVDSAHVAFVSIDAYGTIVEWNHAAERAFGWSRTEAVGLPLAETIIPERYRAAHNKGLARFLDTRQARVLGQRLELSALHRDGHELEVELTISAVRTPQGHLFNAFLHDITARKRAEEELREAEERFRTAFESAPIGMALTAPDGRYVRVNDALCRITGYSQQELEDMSSWDVTHPDHLQADREQLRRLLEGRISVCTGETRYVGADGRETWVSVLSTAMRDSGGRPSRLLSQIQDVGPRRRLEDELRRLAHHDPLTGLPNRRAFELALVRHLALARRYGGDGALLLLDLDRFKRVNDEHGHLVGDRVLVAAAAALRGRVRETDTVARLGGDEFAVLLAKASPDDARGVARSLVAAIAEETAGDAGRRVTASVGLAVVEDGAELTPEALIARADRAMYEAKATGRDRYTMERSQ